MFARLRHCRQFVVRLGAPLCWLVLNASTTTARPQSAPVVFTRITTGPVVTDHGDSTGCAWGDYNQDGFLDLFVSNFGTPFNYLYRNNGDGSFTRILTGDIASRVERSPCWN